MHKKLVLAALIGSSFASLAMAEDAPPASPLSFNVGVVSDYLFRGISQTHGGAALQGGIDYAHPSGFYVGAWGSTITWVKDWLGSGSTEIDVYGGFKNSFAGGDWTYDVGLITYNYPSHGSEIRGALANPNTSEVYGSIGYKWISAKYSHTISSHFVGWYGGPNALGVYDQDTRGSNYLELNANYDMGDGWTLIGHVGHQKVKGFNAVATVVNSADYTDWKIGVSKDVGFGTVSLAYSDTDAKGNCSTPFPADASAYCWGNTGVVSGVSGPTGGFKDVARGTVVLTFLKTF
jgi:uncharacterized protein (TIGR02001 family)